MSVTITKVQGEAIVDSRSVPTLQVTVVGSDGSKGVFQVPSGASTGRNEAHELRDDATSHGGVTCAIEVIAKKIEPALLGLPLTEQRTVDELLIRLDGTEHKEVLGGNTLIGVSVALLKAAAQSEGVEVWQYLHDTYFAKLQVGSPRLYMNLINGGKHAKTSIAFQEYHVVPRSTSVTEALTQGTSIQEALHVHLVTKYQGVTVGDEGGYSFDVSSIEEPLRILKEVTESLSLLEEVDFALDVAASSLYDKERNAYYFDTRYYTRDELLEVYCHLVSMYPIVSIEDPFHEDDFESFAMLRAKCPSLIVVGDDLTTTNSTRLTMACDAKSINGIIIKPNQIGTLTETFETILSAESLGVRTIISHRSGETGDNFIADLAYAVGAFGIKAGARGPKEREAKYARLLAITE